MRCDAHARAQQDVGRYSQGLSNLGAGVSAALLHRSSRLRRIWPCGEKQHVTSDDVRRRLADGSDAAVLDDPGRAAAAEILADGLVDADRYAGGRLVLTRRGRLLADAVVRHLVG